MALIVLLLVAFLGVLAHWKKKHIRGQTLATFYNYMKAHKGHSIKTAISITAAVIALFQVGSPEISEQWLANAFMIGYSFDSALNKAPEDL